MELVIRVDKNLLCERWGNWVSPWYTHDIDISLETLYNIENMKDIERFEIINNNQSKYGSVQFIASREFHNAKRATRHTIVFMVVLIGICFFLSYLGLFLGALATLVLCGLVSEYKSMMPFVIYEKGIKFSNARIKFLPFHEIIDMKPGKGIRWGTPYLGLNLIDGQSIYIAKRQMKNGSYEIQPQQEKIRRIIEQGIQDSRVQHRLKWDKLVLTIINRKVTVSLRGKTKLLVVNYADKNNITHITLDVLARTIEAYPKEFSKKYWYGNFPDYVKKVSSRLEATGTGYRRRPRV